MMPSFHEVPGLEQSHNTTKYTGASYQPASKSYCNLNNERKHTPANAQLEQDGHLQKLVINSSRAAIPPFQTLQQQSSRRTVGPGGAHVQCVQSLSFSSICLQTETPTTPNTNAIAMIRTVTHQRVKHLFLRFCFLVRPLFVVEMTRVSLIGRRYGSSNGCFMVSGLILADSRGDGTADSGYGGGGDISCFLFCICACGGVCGGSKSVGW